MMASLRLGDIAAATGGTILKGDPLIRAGAYAVDSRTLPAGALFFAVPAGRDGHDFVADAARRGAIGAVVSRDVRIDDPRFALIRVGDTVAALQSLARTVLSARPVKVVAVTGSVGKTTTKEFAAALISPTRCVLKSDANFNNHLGLALSVLRLEPDHEVAVLEMAMSAPGEIRTLAGIAPPDVAVITNIAPVHLEFLGTLEAVAAAKAEILEGLRPAGTAVLNADDVRVRALAGRIRGRVLLCGFAEDADIRASGLESLGYEGQRFCLRYDGNDRILQVPFLSDSLVRNLLAALGAAAALGLPWESVASAVAGLRPADKRGAVRRLGRGIVIVDDTYNSSPLALESALRSYARLPAGRRVAVLGEMLELGPDAPRYHEEAGRLAVRLGWDLIAAVGPLGSRIAAGARDEGAPRDRVLEFAGSDEAAGALPALLGPGDLILIKGSRGVRMEMIAESVKARWEEA